MEGGQKAGAQTRGCAVVAALLILLAACLIGAFLRTRAAEARALVGVWQLDGRPANAQNQLEFRGDGTCIIHSVAVPAGPGAQAALIARPARWSVSGSRIWVIDDAPGPNGSRSSPFTQVADYAIDEGGRRLRMWPIGASTGVVSLHRRPHGR